MLGISAGVMISLSFFELLPTAIAELGTSISFGIFFVSLFGYFVIETFLEPKNNDNVLEEEKSILFKIGKISMIVILIHNIPEGIITLTGALIDPNYGIILALAITIHNIPEGIIIGVPIFKATGDKNLTIKYGLVASIAEPFGAIIAIIFLHYLKFEIFIYVSLAFVSGIMIGLSIIDILPTAIKFGDRNQTFYGFATGITVVAVSLIIFGV